MSWLVIAICAVLAGGLIGAIGLLIWLRQTLLSSAGNVEIDYVDQSLHKEVERLELDYAVAQELGFNEKDLVLLETQLNAAKSAVAAEQHRQSSPNPHREPMMIRAVAATSTK